jgi:hypothetical protein
MDYSKVITRAVIVKTVHHWKMRIVVGQGWLCERGFNVGITDRRDLSSIPF